MKSSNSDFLREKLEGLQYVEVENRGRKATNICGLNTEQQTPMQEASGTSTSCHISTNWLGQ